MSALVHVVGAGVMGLGVAWRLASEGWRVVVHDPAGPGRETSRVSAGMLAPRAEVRPAEEDLLAFGARSQGLWSTWVDELSSASGVEIDLRQPGTLVLALDADDRRSVERHLSWLEGIGVAFERLEAEDVQRLEPALSHAPIWGALVHGDGQVDNRALLRALEVRVRALGGEIREGSRVERVVAEGGRVIGVVDGEGTRFPAEHVVVAAGAWSRSVRIDGLAALPVRPVRGQLLAFGCHDRHGQRSTLHHAIHAPDVYLAQKADGTLLAGATMEERGFERETNTLALYEHLRDARRILPTLDHLPLQEIRIGFRPTTRDNRPLIGPTPVEGAWCLTGHFRNGIQQAPASVDALVDWMLGRDIPDDAVGFSPMRVLA